MTLVNGDRVRGASTDFEDDAGGATGGVEAEDCLIGNVHAGNAEVQIIIWVAFSLLHFELRGSSEKRTTCSSGATRNVW